MIRLVQIENIEQIHETFRRLSHWAFRGQQNAEWDLLPSLQRSAHISGFHYETMEKQEAYILSEFQRRAHQYISDPPALDNPLEWIALMQHYGSPTRLLDATYSLYIALFFATEKANNDSAVWAFNIKGISDYLRTIFPSMQSISHVHEEKLICQGHVEICNKILLGVEKSKQIIIPVEPKRMNERLSLQQGLFLFLADITADFNISFKALKTGAPHPNWDSVSEDFNKASDWLMYPFIDDLKAIKFVVPRSLHRGIRHFLWSCNINAQSLFPGLDGFARSLWYWST